MAPNKLLFCLAILSVALPAATTATRFIVGDDSGWTINFDYQAWAKNKVFKVGDELVFNYTPGSHNVFKVNGTGFNDCIIPPKNLALTTGNDVVPLSTAGRKWYICGVKNHCADRGQKLVITVEEGSSSSGRGRLTTGLQTLTAAVALVAVFFSY